MFIEIINQIRAVFMRNAFPSNVKPVSRKFGFDRGTPIDRFWIESFLRDHKKDIHSDVLEIGDRRYTEMFGSNITKSDVLDLATNKQATIQADLSNVPQVKDETFDCIILTHVLGIIPDYQKAIEECFRMLKPHGVLLVTSSCFSPVQHHSPSLWRFTPKGLEYAMKKVFSEVTVSSYGNVLSGQYFWAGMSQEELETEELTYNDPEYPCIATCRAVKM